MVKSVFLLKRETIMLFLSLEAMEALRMHVTPHIPKMALVRGEWSVS
jgi:hypothetical protein